jgi:O-Antigen ligase.
MRFFKKGFFFLKNQVEPFLDKKLFFGIYISLAIAIGCLAIPTFKIYFSLIAFLLIAFYLLFSSGKYNLIIISFLLGSYFVVSNLGGSLSFHSLLFIIYIAKCFLSCILDKVKIYRFMPIIISFFLFSIYDFLISFFHLSIVSLPSQFSFLFYTLFPFAAFIDSRANKKLEIILFTMGVSLLFHDLVSIAFLSIPRIKINVFITNFGRESGLSRANSYVLFHSRFSGLFRDSNEFAFHTAMPCFTYILLMGPRKFKKLPLLVFLPCVGFGFLSGSKSYILVFLLFVVMFFVVLVRHFGVRVLIWICSVLAISIAALYFFNLDIINSVFGRFLNGSGSLLEIITTGRTDIWNMYLNDLFLHPTHFVFGYGAKASYQILFLGEESHNFYINLLFDFGILGTFLYVAYYYSLFKTARFNFKRTNESPYSWFPLILFLVFAFGLTLTGNIIPHFSALIQTLVLHEEPRKSAYDIKRSEITLTDFTI